MKMGLHAPFGGRAGRAVRVAGLGLALLLAPPALAQNETEPTSDPPPAAAGGTADEPVFAFSTDKDGIQLEKFIRWAGQALGQHFIWAPAALQNAKVDTKRVVITEEMKIPKSALLNFVRTNLRVHNLALIPCGPEGARFILVESLEAPTITRTHRIFVPSEELEKYKDAYVLIATTVHVKHVNVQQIQTQIQRLSNTGGSSYGNAIIPAPSENSIIIVDFGPEVYHIARLIKEMDKQGTKFDQTLELIELVHASADEIESMLTQILEEQAQQQQGQPAVQGIGGPKQVPPPKIIPDDRASRLVVYATQEQHEMIAKLVKQIDTEVPASTGRVTVYPLLNSVAEDLVETLQEIMEGASSSSSSTPGAGPGRGSISTSRGGDEVDIVADTGSNAVLIRGSKSQVSEVIEIIKQLDVRKSQVLVEAAILELRHDDQVNLGVELGAFDAKNDLAATFRPFGFTNLGVGDVRVDAANGTIGRIPEISAGGSVTNQGGVFGIFDGDGFLFPVLIQAFQNRGYTNLLSMPSILTNDNEEATIKVSRSVAVSQFNQGAVGQVSTQTFGGFEEAPIELSISPHISTDEYLRLEIRFLVEAFGVGGAAGLPPPKTSREVITSVTVPDGATVVIGGLTLDDQTEVTDQVPILGDIPVLGFLFRSTQTRHQKNTLFLFLTPRILSDPTFKDLEDESTKRKTQIAALQGQIELVDPEFGRRWEMLDRTKTIRDAEATGAFDLPVIHSPTDKRGVPQGGRVVRPAPDAAAPVPAPTEAPKTPEPEPEPDTPAPDPGSPEK